MYHSLIIVLLYFLSVFPRSKELARVEGILYSTGKPVSIEIEDGKIKRIISLSPGDSPQNVFVAPGLIDLQINGYMGIDFSSQDLTLEQMREATKEIWKTGVTNYLPTVVSNDLDKMRNSFRILSEILIDEGIAGSVPGLHLEGPYISPEPGYRGAHLVKYIRDPNWEEFVEFQTACHKKIKLITLAPEVKDAIPFITRCINSGVVVSLGHHAGDASTIQASVRAGATLSTHLGNGCANLINRHLNPLWPQLANENLNISIIVDGFHLTRDEVLCFYKMKGPERTILVSDAVDLAGLPAGKYLRREKELILTCENIVKFPAENVLAGAANPLRECVYNIMEFTDCSLAEAIRMASANPARLLGLDDLGEIKSGNRADMILFKITDKKIVITKTIIKGRIVYEYNS